MADVIEAVYARTAADPAIAAVVGDRVRPGHPLQGDPYPLLLISLVSHRRGHTLTAHDGLADDRIQFDAIGTTAAQVTALARALEALWDGYVGTASGLEIVWAGQLDEVDLDGPAEPGTDAFVRRRAIDYRFKYRTS